MKRLLTVAVVLIAFTTLTSLARAEGSVRVEIHHDFTVGKLTLPAGTYNILRVAPESSGVLLIRSENGRYKSLLLPVSMASNDAGDFQLQFAESSGVYQLTGIDTPTASYTLRAGR
jgi:hypothetical protein